MGKIWGFVIDRIIWHVSHIVVQVSKGLQDRTILISRQALGLPHTKDRVLTVSLSESPDDSTDWSRSPNVTELEVCLEQEQGWAIARPMPLPAFPMPMVRSYYIKSSGTAEKQQDGADAAPQSCRDIIDCQVHAHGETVGRVTDLIVDDDCWQIRYLVVDKGRLLPGRKLILSTLWIRQETENSSMLLVDIPADVIERSPEYDQSSPLTRTMESEVFSTMGEHHIGRKGTKRNPDFENK
ncbi:MAG: PRC-barrel domain-containing protein [Fidelibacterota bacterium]